jgi:hypothetical protein
MSVVFQIDLSWFDAIIDTNMTKRFSMVSRPLAVKAFTRRNLGDAAVVLWRRRGVFRATTLQPPGFLRRGAGSHRMVWADMSNGAIFEGDYSADNGAYPDNARFLSGKGPGWQTHGGSPARR